MDCGTVAKYMVQELFLTEAAQTVEGASGLDPFKKTFDEWLGEDRRMRFKQRHTAKRVHERLQEELGEAFHCSYSVVQRYLRSRKDRRKISGSLELVWAPGQAQGDFGEANVISEGVSEGHDQVLGCQLPVQQRGLGPSISG